MLLPPGVSFFVLIFPDCLPTAWKCAGRPALACGSVFWAWAAAEGLHITRSVYECVHKSLSVCGGALSRRVCARACVCVALPSHCFPGCLPRCVGQGGEPSVAGSGPAGWGPSRASLEGAVVRLPSLPLSFALSALILSGGGLHATPAWLAA